MFIPQKDLLHKTPANHSRIWEMPEAPRNIESQAETAPPSPEELKNTITESQEDIVESLSALGAGMNITAQIDTNDRQIIRLRREGQDIGHIYVSPEDGKFTPVQLLNPDAEYPSERPVDSYNNGTDSLLEAFQVLSMTEES